MPNILQCNESFIVADTKGNLVRKLGSVLAKNGYQVINIDFTDMRNSYGYNPLDYIRYDRKRKKYLEEDIMRIAACLIPMESRNDPFWDLSARMYVEAMIGYVLECLPKKEHTLKYVCELVSQMSGEYFNKLFRELEELNPDSFAIKRYQAFQGSEKAEKTFESIHAVIAGKLNALNFDGPVAMYGKKNRVNFAELGKEKTAVFLTISDTDRSMDKLCNLFYTQALQMLCASADHDYADNRLPVPVRIILDDFATNVCIPDFDKIISVIRSREISVSIILQSITQLEGLYDHAKAMTIVNNCDNCLYLGGQDLETAQFIANKADKIPISILNMPLNEAYLFTRGREARLVQKFDVTTHEKYGEVENDGINAPVMEEQIDH